MQPYQQRVIEERQQLIERINKLRTFVSDDNGPFSKLSMHEQDLLLRQLMVMEEYEDILNERISIF